MSYLLPAPKYGSTAMNNRNRYPHIREGQLILHNCPLTVLCLPKLLLSGIVRNWKFRDDKDFPLHFRVLLFQAKDEQNFHS